MSTALPETLDAGDLSAALATCDRLLGEHLDAFGAVFGAPVLGLVDLPPLSGTRIEPAQLRVVPPLYWAREVEAAGLLAVVDALAEGVVRGTVVDPIGGAIHTLVTWWREREERFGPQERQSVYSRLFGGPGNAAPNDGFEESLASLARTLSELGRTPANRGVNHLEVRVGVLARDLAGALSERSAGIAAFAARDIVGQIRSALALLRNPELASGLGGGEPWTLVRRLSFRLLGRPVEPSRPLARAEAGLRLLTWLADVASRLEGGVVPVGRGDEVVQAAERWLTVSGRA
ncbi:hypothetical protein P2318_16600 [Myxococcaceae bacterium GXIMD 01537]